MPTPCHLWGFPHPKPINAPFPEETPIPIPDEMCRRNSPAASVSLICVLVSRIHRICGVDQGCQQISPYISDCWFVLNHGLHNLLDMQRGYFLYAFPNVCRRIFPFFSDIDRILLQNYHLCHNCHQIIQKPVIVFLWDTFFLKLCFVQVWKSET